MDLVKWSFIIPVKNGEQDLARCIGSIRRQNLPTERYEIIVVDNGSEDKSQQKAQELGAAVFCELTPGPASARNLGIEQSKGEWLVFLDVDVELAGDWIEQSQQLLERRWIDVVQSPIIPIGPFNDPLMEDFRLRYIGLKTNGKFEHLGHSRERQVQINSAAFAIKRAALKKNIRFDPQLLRCEDTDFTFQLWLGGANFALMSATKAWVHDRRTWWQYLWRSLRTGFWSGKVVRQWGQEGCWSMPFIGGNLLIVLNSLAVALGTLAGAVGPTEKQKFTDSLKPDLRNLFYWVGQPGWRLNPWVRIVDLHEELVLMHLKTGDRSILSGERAQRLRLCLEKTDNGTLKVEEDLLPASFLIQEES